jgi:hypothetical protein
VQTQVDSKVSKSGGDTITVASGTTVPLTIQNDGTGNSFVVNDATSDTTPFVISETGNVGVGTIPFSNFKIHSYDPTLNTTWLEGDGNVALNVQRSSTDANAPSINLRKTRGTSASKTTLSNNDGIGLIQFFGHDGTNPVNSASINTTVDNTVSTGIVPGRIAFLTTDSSGVSATRMTLKSSGNVGIGTAAPGYPLDVNGTVNATAFTVGGVPLASGGMTVLASGTLSGPLTLSSISGAYKDLRLVLAGPQSSASSTITMQINGVTSSTYSTTFFNLQNSPVLTHSSSTTQFQGIGRTEATGNATQYSDINFPNYSSTVGHWRFINGIGGNQGASAGWVVGRASGVTSAITQISVLTSFTGGSYILYGVS